MKNRNDIKEFISNLETMFPVDNWQYKGIHLWPIIKLKIYFFLIYSFESNKSVDDIIKISKTYLPKKENKKYNFIYKLKTLYNLWVYIKKYKYVKYIFYGHSNLNSKYKNESEVNRLFYPIINKYNLEKKSLLIEYGPEKKSSNYYANMKVNIDAIFPAYNFLQVNNFFKIFKPKGKTDLDSYDDLIQYLNNNEYTKHFEKTNDNLTEIIEYINFYYPFYYFLIKIISPKILFIAPYYNGLNSLLFCYVARSLNIDVVEVQHGPQTETHGAYSYWNKIPVNGFNTMPNHFWCWEESSKNNILNWNKFGKVFTGGNPWIEYNLNSQEIIEFNEPFILYTLQPFPLTFETMFPDVLINCICKSNIKWYIKLHPQMANEYSYLKEFLSKKNINDFCEIKLANTLPLPVLLNSCFFHVSNFSGSIIEASIIGKRSIIFHEIGYHSFKSIIQNNLAIYLPFSNSDFENVFFAFYQKCSVERNINNQNFVEEEIIKSLLND